MNFDLKESVPIVRLSEKSFEKRNIMMDVLRIDSIHKEISGNKWYKLKYNIDKALKTGAQYILTFGGAFSNHIAATAEAGRVSRIPTIGIIRGEEVENQTLALAKKAGMKLNFITRGEYRKKDEPDFLNNLRTEYPGVFIIPEGGSNEEGVKGAVEILKGLENRYDIICCSVGTGGTLSGLIRATDKSIIGFPALKNTGFLEKDIEKLLGISKTNWSLINDYHFGGYAKFNNDLLSFINQFREKHNIQLDPIYTGKMMYGVYREIEKSNSFHSKNVLVIHTGGLQGIPGFEKLNNVKIS